MLSIISCKKLPGCELSEAQIYGYMRMPLESFYCFVLLAEEYHLVYPKYPVYLVSGFGHPNSVGYKQHSKGLYRSEPDRVPKQREGNGHKPRSLTQKLFPIHNHPIPHEKLVCSNRVALGIPDMGFPSVCCDCH